MPIEQPEVSQQQRHRHHHRHHPDQLHPNDDSRQRSLPVQKRAVPTVDSFGSQPQTSPSTPPPPQVADLPTPPNSRVELRLAPHPATADPDARSSTSSLGQQRRLDASPTTSLTHNTAPRRAAGRLSGGGGASIDTDRSTSPSPRRTNATNAMDTDQRRGGAPAPADDERRRVLDLASKALNQRSSRRSQRSVSSDRSRTPSPILGAQFRHQDAPDPESPSVRVKSEGEDPTSQDHADPLGRLSVPMLGLGLGPSKEELALLVYGASADDLEPSSKVAAGDEARDIEQTLKSLSEMGLGDTSKAAGASEREKELAAMVRLLAERCGSLSVSRDRIQAELNSNRVTALSVISSMKTAHAHTLATERGVRDRLDAELEGWKAQAKMLSVLLSRAEGRSFTERRLADGTDSGRPSHSVWPSTGRLATSRSDDSIAGMGIGRTSPDMSNAVMSTSRHGRGALDPTSPSKAGYKTGLSEPPTPAGEENRGRDRSRESLACAAAAEARAEGITGLGITHAGATDPGPDESPISALNREKNKLVTDKRFLKARLRDTEAQVHRLESELKALRPYLVAGGIKASEGERAIGSATAGESAAHGAASSQGPAAIDGAISAPATPSRSGSRRDKSRKKRTVTMGDAETEHLMLAARRLREMRKEQTAAVSNAEAAASTSQRAPTLAPNGMLISVLAPAAEVSDPSVYASPVKRQASEGADGDQPAARSPRTPISKTGERPPKTPKSNTSVPTTPRMAEAVRYAEAPRPSVDAKDATWNSQHKRLESGASVSSFSGIDELLQAAETLNPGAAVSSPTVRTLPESQPPAFVHADVHPRYPRDPVPVHPVQMLHPIHTRGAEYDPYGYPQHYHHPASSPIRLPHESPKRRRVSSAAIDAIPFGSPFLSDRQPRGRTSTEGADPYGQLPAHAYPDYAHSGPSSAGASQALSALDLLADQAAASQNPSQGSDRSGGYEGVSPLGSLSSDDEAMAMDGGSTSRSKRSRGPDGSKASSLHKSSKGPRGAPPKDGMHGGGRPSGNDGSQGSSKSNGESRSFGGNQNPEKRLPYVRWTNEEDTKLRAAIKEHGQRWELISRAVGTRSYHQCRQRYLLMRRKEAAAKAQAEADEPVNTPSASASDQQSQEEGDYARGPPASASVSRRRSGASPRRGAGASGGRSTNDERYDDHSGGGFSDDGGSDPGNTTITPLHKLSIGAPPSGGASSFGPYSPTPRHGPLGPTSHSPAHVRSLSHPHSSMSSGSLPPNSAGPVPPLSPYSSHHSATTPTSRRSYYPSSSPLIPSSRQLPPLSSHVGAPPYASSPTHHHAPIPSSPLHHHRTFLDGPPPPPPPPLASRGGLPPPGPPGPNPTSPTGSSSTAATTTPARRMGAALYS